MRNITFFSEEYVEQRSFYIRDLSLSEYVVKQKCLGYFGDEDPCIIHINYISKRMIIEIEEILSKHFVNNRYYDIGNNLVFKSYLDVPSNYIYFKVTQ